MIRRLPVARECREANSQGGGSWPTVAAVVIGVVTTLALAEKSGSAPAEAAPMEPQAEDADRRHSHELARDRSRRAAGGRKRLG